MSLYRRKPRRSLVFFEELHARQALARLAQESSPLMLRGEMCSKVSLGSPQYTQGSCWIQATYCSRAYSQPRSELRLIARLRCQPALVFEGLSRLYLALIWRDRSRLFLTHARDPASHRSLLRALKSASEHTLEQNRANCLVKGIGPEQRAHSVSRSFALVMLPLSKTSGARNRTRHSYYSGSTPGHGL